jgi:hypothetical protein
VLERPGVAVAIDVLVAQQQAGQVLAQAAASTATQLLV